LPAKISPAKISKDPFMSASIRALIETVADIGTAVRASREYSRLSVDAPPKQSERGTISAFLPK
jgi:hypothetical protein